MTSRRHRLDGLESRFPKESGPAGFRRGFSTGKPGSYGRGVRFLSAAEIPSDRTTAAPTRNSKENPPDFPTEVWSGQTL